MMPTKTILTMNLPVAKGKAQLVLRLYGSSSGLIFERDFIETTQAKQTQVLAIEDLESLRQFIDADPYYVFFSAEFDRIYTAASTAIEQMK